MRHPNLTDFVWRLVRDLRFDDISTWYYKPQLRGEEIVVRVYKDAKVLELPITLDYGQVVTVLFNGQYVRISNRSSIEHTEDMVTKFVVTELLNVLARVIPNKR